MDVTNVADAVVTSKAVIVKGQAAYLDVAPVLDTSIYASGDILFIPTIINGAIRNVNGTGIIHSILLIDEDDLGLDLDLVFFSANPALGTINAAPSITDALFRNYLGKVSFVTADYVDFGGARGAQKTGINLMVEAADGTDDIYVAGITRGTPTHTISGLKLRIGMLQD